jgi:signal peptidase II
MRAVPFNRYLLFLLIASAGCLTDLATKQWIFQRLGMPGGDTWWFWKPFVGLQTSTNEGALFGLGQGRVWIFACASIVAVLGILYWLFLAGAARDWLLTVALAMVMGGVLGNLHDRFGLWRVPGVPGAHMNAVRDWILIQWPPWVWPNFNVADSLLVCGGALFAWHALTHAPAQKADQTESARQNA